MLLQMLGALAMAQEKEQPVEKDTELWTGGTLKIEFTKKLRLEVEQQYRFDDNVSTLDNTFTEMGLRYEFTDWFDAKGQYRFTVNDEARNENRLSLDLSFAWNIDDNPLEFGYRFRATDTRTSYTDEKSTYLRNRFSVDYNLSKLADPYFEYESFYKLNDKMEFRTNRYTLGLEWKINDEAEVETFYRVEDEFNTSQRELVHIIGLSISYELEFH